MKGADLPAVARLPPEIWFKIFLLVPEAGVSTRCLREYLTVSRGWRVGLTVLPSNKTHGISGTGCCRALFV
jgi:hypothetical protein